MYFSDKRRRIVCILISFEGCMYTTNHMDADKSPKILIMESMVSSGWRDILCEIRI